MVFKLSAGLPKSFGVYSLMKSTCESHLVLLRCEMTSKMIQKHASPYK